MAATNREVFNREKGGFDSDFLDDSALIKAFDNAVNPIKAMIGETHGPDGPPPPSAASTSNNISKKKSQKRSSGKSKRKDDSRSEATANGIGQKPSEWQIGSRCRAVYSADGGLYDAVIASVDNDAGTCTVRYDYYNNEEAQQLDDLLLPLSDISASVRHNCSNVTRSDAGSAASVDSVPSGCGAHLPHNTCNHQHPQHHHHYQHSCHASTRKNRRKFRPVPPFPPPGSSFPPPPGMTPPFFPPGLMPEQLLHSTSFPIFPPPPPPSPSTTADDGDKDKESLYSMLISWYMCGYYTGFYHGSSSRGGVADSTVTGTTSEDADDSFTQDHVH